MTQEPSPDFEQRVTDFIRREFPARTPNESVHRLAGGASILRYFRYTTGQETFILTAHPEGFDPLHFPYQQVYDLLRSIGLPVPEILRIDDRLGIVLQEDLGDESLERHLLAGTSCERKKYLHQAIDHLILLQKKGPRALKPHYQAAQTFFDKRKLKEELLFFFLHYLEGHRKQKVEREQLTWEFSALAGELAQLPRFLCHRDYQVRNLILKKNLLYIIDFQDARWGPACYDLVSLLQDSIELEQDQIGEHMSYFLQHAEHLGEVVKRRQEFQQQFHLMSIQRLLKALGTYGYQTAVKGNLTYQRYMPGSLKRALRSLQFIARFPYIRSIVESELSHYQ